MRHFASSKQLTGDLNGSMLRTAMLEHADSGRRLPFKVQIPLDDF
jgi:hypothetical protein